MRTATVLGTLMLALSVGLVGVAAQDATPAAIDSWLATIGYPELLVTVTDDDFEVAEEIEAGRYLVTLENVGQGSRHSLLLRLPDGLEPDLEADLGPDAEAPPAWLFDAIFPGFPGETLPGERSHAVVDLEPGRHVLIDDFFETFDVVPSADAITDLTEAPAADALVTTVEMAFELPDQIAAGPQVWEVTNVGQQVHEVLLIWSPVPITADDILALFMLEEDATPPPGVPSFEELEPAGGLGWLSPGQTAWTEVDLRPGTYVAICFVPDPETFTPHAFMGMIEIFTVDG